MLVRPWAWRKFCYGSVSLCMIMRNEEKLLQRCLNSVRGFVDEIIIVDTGSTDRSVEIARANGAVVLFDEWRDDFARPRNVGISAATKDWIFILDPDEVVSPNDHCVLRALTAVVGVSAYRMATRNYTNNPSMQGCIPNDGKYAEAAGWVGYVPSVKTRLFRNGEGVRFVGRWHELADYSLDKMRRGVACTTVPIHHYGNEINQKDWQTKKEFYLRMGELKVADDPSNDQAWWELGVSEGIMGYHARAARSIKMSMRKGYTTPDRLFQLVFALNKCGKVKEGSYFFEKAICLLYPNLTHYNVGLRSLASLDPHLDRKIV